MGRKITIWIFQETTKKYCIYETWTWLRKRKRKELNLCNLQHKAILYWVFVSMQQANTKVNAAIQHKKNTRLDTTELGRWSTRNCARSYILIIQSNLSRSGKWTFVILNKGQTTIWEEIEIYSQEKVYTIERLLVDKNIGLVNTE